jgi:hypothetical protein
MCGSLGLGFIFKLIDVIARPSVGVRVGAGGEWTQSAPAQIRIDSPIANGTLRITSLSNASWRACLA